MKRLATICVKSGWHHRTYCPMTARLDVAADIDPATLHLQDVAGNELPLQAWREDDAIQLAWIVENEPACATIEYHLVSGGVMTAPDERVLVSDTGDKLIVNINGERFTVYNYADVVRPYLYPVLASGGVGITRDWPMVPDAEGDTRDHPHHKGIYTAQGAVNGVDNWSEVEGHGYQVHQVFTRIYSGPVAGGFSEILHWTDADHQPNMTETRRLTFYNAPAECRLIDYEITFEASQGPVVMGDTKEGGLIAVRVATSMDVTGDMSGGRFVNGYGAVLEDEAWGQRAPWCDYSGPTELGWRGVCLMDHQNNPRYPTFWHVRNYGLMTANPIALHDFTGDPNNTWDLVIPAGESLTWHYRILVHDGDAADANATERYHDFCNPPQVEVIREDIS